MNADQRELTQRLFAVATIIASEAEEIAIKGQSPKLSAVRYRAVAIRLQRLSEDLANLAKAIGIVSGR